MSDQLPLMDVPTDIAGSRRRRAERCLAIAPDRPGVVIEIPGADWVIDEHTKEVGLAGVAAAREALAAAVGRSAA